MNTFKIKKLGRKGKTNSDRGVLTYLVPSVSFIIEEREKRLILQKRSFQREESTYTVHD